MPVVLEQRKLKDTVSPCQLRYVDTPCSSLNKNWPYFVRQGFAVNYLRSTTLRHVAGVENDDRSLVQSLDPYARACVHRWVAAV